MNRALVFALGAAADARFGDPPTSLHPVGLVGQAAVQLRARAPRDARSRARYGERVAIALPIASGLAAGGIILAARRRHWLLGVAAASALLALACSLRTLRDRAAEVERALAAGDIARARALAGMHLVSRDTSALDAAELASATIESVAENLCDGVIAPWLAYALGGVPAAWAYRAVNTLDALWGYRDEEFAALGRAAARIDDAANLLPARLTALAIVLAAATPSDGANWDARQALEVWQRDARHTASPNAGHPIAAMAGALGVRLAKRTEYTLGAEFTWPSHNDIARATALARRASWLTAAGLFGAMALGGMRR